MSYEAETWVRQQRVGNLTDRAVLLEIAFHVHTKTGLSCPGLNKLSEDLGASVNTVRAAIARLEKKGFLKTEAVVVNGYRAGTIYVLNGFDYSRCGVSNIDIRKTLSSEEAQETPGYGLRLKALLEWWKEHLYLFMTNPSVLSNSDISNSDTPPETTTFVVSNFDTNKGREVRSKKKRKLLKEKSEPSLFDEQTSETAETETETKVEEKPEEVTLNLDAPATFTTALERHGVTSMPAKWRAWLEECHPDLDADFLWRDFVDYWGTDGGGEKARKKRWFATFKNRVKLLPDFIRNRAKAAKTTPAASKATPPAPTTFSDQTRYGSTAGSIVNAIDVGVTEIMNLLIDADFDVMLNSNALMSAATHLAETIDDVKAAARLILDTPPQRDETPENYKRRLNERYGLSEARV